MPFGPDRADGDTQPAEFGDYRVRTRRPDGGHPRFARTLDVYEVVAPDGSSAVAAQITGPAAADGAARARFERSARPLPLLDEDFTSTRPWVVLPDDRWVQRLADAAWPAEGERPPGPGFAALRGGSAAGAHPGTPDDPATRALIQRLAALLGSALLLLVLLSLWWWVMAWDPRPAAVTPSRSRPPASSASTPPSTTGGTGTPPTGTSSATATGPPPSGGTGATGGSSPPPATGIPSQPTGPDGKPVPLPTGTDGKPLPYPTGPDGKPLPYPTGTDGKPVPWPVGPDGKPLPLPTGTDGKPLPWPLGPGGTLPGPLDPWRDSMPTNPA